MGSPGKPPTTSPVNLENTKESALVKPELAQVTPGDLPTPQMLPFLLSGQAVSRYSIYLYTGGSSVCQSRSFLNFSAAAGGGESTPPLRHRLLKKLGQEAPLPPKTADRDPWQMGG